MKIYLLFFLTLLSSCATFSKLSSDKISIIQGLTTEKEVELTLVTKNKNLKIELLNLEGKSLVPIDQKMVEHLGSAWVVHKVYFQRPDQSYGHLLVNSSFKKLDERFLGEPLKSDEELKLAITSCMNDDYGHELKIWSEVVKRKPHYILMIGDNVYVDHKTKDVTPDLIWQRYVETRMTLPIFFEKKLIPIHALWDDHDFGLNNANTEFKHKEESKAIFDTFFAQSFASENYQKGFGVGGLLSLQDFNLYFLDARSFREKDPQGEHLGKEQTQWLTNYLKEENKPSLIIKGDQFFGGYHQYESFEKDHPEKFQSFVKDIKEVKTPVIFISGDRHLSELMQFPRSLFGVPSYEITSSPIHAKTWPESLETNPWRVVSVESKSNFIFMKNTAKDDHWFIDLESIGVNGESFFRREIAVYIKDLKENLNEVRRRRFIRRRPRR